MLDDYVYATTSPIYVNVEGSVPKPADDAAFFIAWIDRLVASDKRQQELEYDRGKRSPFCRCWTQARQVYVRLQK